MNEIISFGIGLGLGTLIFLSLTEPSIGKIVGLIGLIVALVAHLIRIVKP